jgi:ParB family chromosome partitioning protein
MALGKGLSALLPEAESVPGAHTEHFLCPVDRIRPNRFQPRSRFDEDELEALSRSIREQGVIQPLLVRRDGGGYELIAGERRLRAARRAGLEEVPVVVRSVSDEALLEMSIVENIQREDLNPLEEADAYHHLITHFGLTQEEVAARVGKSRPSVANTLRLRGLPENVKASIREGALNMGHARALLGARNSAVLNAAWHKVVSGGLSVRETEALIRRLNRGEPHPPAPVGGTEDPYFRGIAEALSRHFGTKVQIRRKGRRGRLEVEFYSDEDLDRILRLLEAV